MWRKIHRCFSCCGRSEEQDEVETIQQHEEGKIVQRLAKEVPTVDGVQDRQDFLRKFCAMYNWLMDDLSVNSSGEREVFLRECHGMYSRVMEELLMGAPRGTVGGLPASAPPACGALEPPRRKGKRRQRRRAGPPSPPPSPPAASRPPQAAAGRHREGGGGKPATVCASEAYGKGTASLPLVTSQQEGHAEAQARRH